MLLDLKKQYKTALYFLACTSTSLSDLREKLDTAETSLYVKEQVTGAGKSCNGSSLWRYLS